MKYIISAYLTFVFASPFFTTGLPPSMQSIPAYFAFLVFLLLFLLNSLLQPRLIRKSDIQKVDLIPLIFLATWFYGFTIGVINGNNIAFIVRNFAGMVLYISYFILIIQKPPKIKMIKFVIIFSLFYICDSFYSFFNAYMNGTIIFSMIGSTRYYFSTGTLIIFPLMSLLIAKILFSQKKLNSLSKIIFLSKIFNSKTISLILLVVCILAGIIFPFSKGNIVGFVFIAFSLFICHIIARNVSSTKKAISIIISFFVGLYIIMFISNNNITLNPFNMSLEGNQTRFEQLSFLLSDLNFFGRGLGAEIDGYARDQNNRYGFEITYFNLIHKFGFMSLPLFVCYVISLFIPLKNILSNKEIYQNSLAFGMMGFLFPSIGNPMLFSPMSCLLHCTSNYLIRKS